jgi:hypothetical protein
MGRTQCDVVKDEQKKKFQNGEGPVVGSNEERFKFG